MVFSVIVLTWTAGAALVGASRQGFVARRVALDFALGEDAVDADDVRARLRPPHGAALVHRPIHPAS